MRHYGCHPMAAFATLPVRDVVAANALLWFWTTGPLISIGAHIPVMHAWGFEPTAMGFVWVKLNPKASRRSSASAISFWGQGLTTRKNAEYRRPWPAWPSQAARQGRVRDHRRAAPRVRPQA